MSDTDRLGEAIAISKARYGRPRKPKPWGPALITTFVVFVLIGGIAAALIVFS